MKMHSEEGVVGVYVRMEMDHIIQDGKKSVNGGFLNWSSNLENF